MKPNNASHFRQQVETLRRLGGSDWLRLLNQMQKIELSNDLAESEVLEKVSDNSMSKSHTCTALEKEESSNLTSTDVDLFAFSTEMSFPEWMLSLDFKNQLFQQCTQHLIQEKAAMYHELNHEKETNDCISDPNEVIWTILIMRQNGSISQIPLCLLLFPTEIILFKLENIMSTSSPSSISFITSHIPKLCHFQTFMPSNILTVYVGPRRAYAEIQIGTLGGIQNFLFFLPSSSVADRFFGCMESLYSLAITEKQSPFVRETLILEEFHCSSELAKSSVQRQILFCRRVMPSKVVSCAHPGTIHYVAVTPSHVVLMEEKLTFPHVLSLDSIIYPSFHACEVISIRTNISNIHLKDENGAMEDKSDFVEEEKLEEVTEKESNLKNPHIEQLYTYGAWLFMEFETATTLYIRFLTLRDRSEFLEAFLCVRSQ